MSNIQQWLDAITNAGFVKTFRGDIWMQLLRESVAEEIRRNNDTTTLYFHASVFDMPPDQQKEQPWIEHHVFAKWLGYPDAIEGRFGSMRFPFHTIESLHSFMQTFGYTDTKQIT